MSFRRYLSSVVCIVSLLAIPAACSSINLPNNATATTEAELSAKKLQELAQSITVRVQAGESQGSGILIAKTGRAYFAVTNAHVVNRGEPYRIVTPDGKTHAAFLKNKGDSWSGNDLAILEFQASENYTIANIGDSASLLTNQKVFAAGFPYQSDRFTFSSGKISLIAEKPLVGGYQIGFSNQTHQGMSSGPLLNEKGEVIGVLGQGNIAILEYAYTYQDGSRPDERTLAQMRNSSFAVPTALLKQQTTKSQTAQTSTEADSYSIKISQKGFK